MSKNKNRYKRIKDRFIASAGGGLVAGMIFIGSANTVLAETINTPSYSRVSTTTGMHVMRRWNSRQRINTLVNTLGLDQATIDEEIKSGKTIKQILVENGVDTSSLDKAFNGKSRHKTWKKYRI
jgi:hypothetical protein